MRFREKQDGRLNIDQVFLPPEAPGRHQTEWPIHPQCAWKRA
jgi:hypothetical protein